MTDDERKAQIDATLDAVRKFWLAHPEWRLGQILMNVSDVNPFYVKDDDLARSLNAWTRTNKP